MSAKGPSSNSLSAPAGARRPRGSPSSVPTHAPAQPGGCSAGTPRPGRWQTPPNKALAGGTDGSGHRAPPQARLSRACPPRRRRLPGPLDGSGEECVSGAGKAECGSPLPSPAGRAPAAARSRRRRAASEERAWASRRAQPCPAQPRTPGQREPQRAGRAGARPLPGAMAEVTGGRAGIAAGRERDERCLWPPRGSAPRAGSDGRRGAASAASRAGSRRRPVCGSLGAGPGQRTGRRLPPCLPGAVGGKVSGAA